jgi:hypothetical protein
MDIPQHVAVDVHPQQSGKNRKKILGDILIVTKMSW